MSCRRAAALSRRSTHALTALVAEGKIATLMKRWLDADLAKLPVLG